jgi:putative spermidine/putrescine transport system permease protein
VAVVTNKSNNNGDAPLARPHTRRMNWDWLGVAPFFVFATLFLFLPSISIFIRSFQTRAGEFTFENIIALFTQTDIVNA